MAFSLAEKVGHAQTTDSPAANRVTVLKLSHTKSTNGATYLVKLFPSSKFIDHDVNHCAREDTTSHSLKATLGISKRHQKTKALRPLKESPQ